MMEGMDPSTFKIDTFGRVIDPCMQRRLTSYGTIHPT